MLGEAGLWQRAIHILTIFSACSCHWAKKHFSTLVPEKHGPTAAFPFLCGKSMRKSNWAALKFTVGFSRI